MVTPSTRIEYTLLHTRSVLALVEAIGEEALLVLRRAVYTHIKKPRFLGLFI